MTIIIGAVGPQVVALAADSLRSGDDGSRRHVSKMRKLSERVVVAKGGYGDLSDVIWDQLCALPSPVRANPYAVADAIQKQGQAVYASCKKVAEQQNKEDLGLYFIVAGIDQNDRGVLISIDIAMDELKTFDENDGVRVLGMGSIPNANDLALKIANQNVSSLNPVKWVQDVVRAAIEVDKNTIGFPAQLYIGDKSGMNQQVVQP